MSSYSEGQTHQLVDALESAGFTPEDVTTLGQFPDLQAIRDVLHGLAEIQIVKRTIARMPFDPAKQYDKGWSWWRGPTDGNGLEGDEDYDPRSLALSEMDFTQVRLETCLDADETNITGHEKVRRLKASGLIRLDPGFGWALYNEPGQKTLRWLHDTFGTTYLDFFGRLLRDPGGYCRALGLCRSDDGSWGWCVSWLGYGWDAGYPSPSLPPSSTVVLVA